MSIDVAYTSSVSHIDLRRSFSKDYVGNRRSSSQLLRRNLSVGCVPDRNLHVTLQVLGRSISRLTDSMLEEDPFCQDLNENLSPENPENSFIKDSVETNNYNNSSFQCSNISEVENLISFSPEENAKSSNTESAHENFVPKAVSSPRSELLHFPTPENIEAKENPSNGYHTTIELRSSFKSSTKNRSVKRKSLINYCIQTGDSSEDLMTVYQPQSSSNTLEKSTKINPKGSSDSSGEENKTNAEVSAKNSSNGFGVRLRRRTSSMRSELRRTFRSLSVNFSAPTTPDVTEISYQEPNNFVGKSLFFRRSISATNLENKRSKRRSKAQSLILPRNKAYDESSLVVEEQSGCADEQSLLERPGQNLAPPSECFVAGQRPASEAFNRSPFFSHSDWDIRNSICDSGGSYGFSQSACQLEEVPLSHRRGGGIQQFQKIEESPLSMPYILSSSNNVAEGMFQKFKKSLSLRLNKKISRSEFQEKPSRPQPQEKPSRPQPEATTETKQNHFRFGPPIFRSSKERKKKLRETRSSHCNSGDSGDSGIEGLTGECDLGSNDKLVRRTHSDVLSKPSSPFRNVDSMHRQSLGRQYSSPQPIKVRPLHRLPNYNSAHLTQNQPRIKRSKGSAHLRRSVSQPLDLDKSFQDQVSLMKIRVNGETKPTIRQRRPSVDNLLCEDNTSEDEGALSDNEGGKNETKRPSEEDEEGIVYAEALWDHVSLDSDELVFKAGDLITVVDSSDRDWWWGKISNRTGWFPASFVRLLVNQEDHQNKHEIYESIYRDCKFNRSCSSYDQIRSNVINEILSTERDYVKHLKDVVEGYLTQVRKRPDMFSEDSISTIFGNMEELYRFHTKFLEELEQYIEFDEPHRSCIGECFIRNKPKFEIYSEYCNNHPSAVSELQQLYENQKYVHFFEACRLLQEMIDISLDGFLLTPVQKICKYPLQLQELLKYTRPNHSDFNSVQGAMHAMKEVALLVNERRRRMECLEKIAIWQRVVEGWEGPELLDDSSQLIHQGEVTKGVGGSWPKEVTLFLFDHQIIYCKRDLLKRNTFVYRGRINTDLCEVIDIPDDPMRSASFHNAWKIHCLDKNKTYVFTCKTAPEKNRWLDAFKKERDLVVLDEVSGFVVSEKQKQVARIAAKNHNCRPKKPKTPKSHKRSKAMTYAQAKLLVSDIHVNSAPEESSFSKKKGLWFGFNVNRKTRGSSRTSKLSLQI